MTIKGILTDIEGTTSSISFVHDVLFPYARQRIPEFIRSHKQNGEIQTLISSVAELTERKTDSEGVIKTLLQWMDEDRKVAPLKELQGLIWEAGYRSGDFTAHVYEDAYRNLTKWHQAGLPIYIYSSGSVHAQKLFFAHSDYGDLTEWISGYFDTRTGPKFEPESYHIISKKMAIDPKNILFLSDIKNELDAAKRIGMETVWLVRDRVIEDDPAHHQVASFNDIQLD